MPVPLVDFASYDLDRADSLSKLAGYVGGALSDIGFLSVINLGIPHELRRRVFSASRQFFGERVDHKLRSGYVSATENFGYQTLCQEHLDPHKPADLKESFTMRNAPAHPRDDERWPSTEFRDLMCEFFATCLTGAFKVQRVLASALDLEPEYFVRCHSGENCTLRLLYYPSSGVDVRPAQLGAGEHTDYGMLTLLFQDGVGGLEVLDRGGAWHPVDCVDGAIVVNSGDMLERWTNGRYRSTRHRVQPKLGDCDRFSIAMFVDPDSATEVAALDSCVSESEPARFPPVTAGEHLLERLRASHGEEFGD